MTAGPEDPEDPEVEPLAAWAARIAAEAPPLTEDTRERLRTLLAPGVAAGRADHHRGLRDAHLRAAGPSTPPPRRSPRPRRHQGASGAA